jgi:hypothetical protein
VGRDELLALWTRHGGGRAAPPLAAGTRTGDAEVWARSENGGQIAHLDASGWTVAERLTSGDFVAVQMIGDADGWALSRSPAITAGTTSPYGGPPRDGLFRWDGRAWRFARPLPERMHALWASGPADVWVAGEHGLVLHWDGSRWSAQRLTGDLHTVWGRARDDIWINGCRNNFYHWNGAAWSRTPNPVPPDHAGECTKLWGASATDVLAVGGRTSLRWNGAAWTKAAHPIGGAGRDTPAFASVSALWGPPASRDVWAVGGEASGPSFDGWPLVLRGTAGRWDKLPAPQTEGHLYAVWGDRDDDVWAVGSKGLILHWDGAAWTREESGVAETLMSIHGAGGTAWIVGERGTVLVRSFATRGRG